MPNVKNGTGNTLCKNKKGVYMAQTILRWNDISKNYAGVQALKNVSIAIEKGEVHAFVGENGAGKSTLIKCASGAISPTSGSIEIQGKSFSALTPKASAENGIAVIYQEFNLVGELSVAENIFLGKAPRKGNLVIDRAKMREKAAAIFKELELDINPDALVKTLTVGYQQLIEISKALSQNAKVLIMDEPTAPLSKNEVRVLFKIVKKLVSQGLTIIYVSHRMDEIFELSNRITVLRDGQTITTLNTKETNLDEVLRLMVGRPITEQFPQRESKIASEALFEAKNLSGNGVTDVSFKIFGGEILGFAGLVGAGRTETAELIFGVKKRERGEMLFKGKPYSPKSLRNAIESGIALVPEDRKHQGALLSMDIQNNITLAILQRLSKFFVINKKADREMGEDFRRDLKIKTPSLKQLVKNLSGGNQQKVVVAKWLATCPDLIILDEPTRGIDVGAKYEIYKLMNELVAQGKTILMISSEMEELIGMADRIAVFAEGRITGFVDKKDFSQELIMRYASKSAGYKE